MDRTPMRREKLGGALAADRVDALLVTSATNVSYLTGFTGDSSALLLARDRALIVSDGRYEAQIAQECPGLEVHIRPVGQPLTRAIAEVAGKLGARRLAFEATALSVAEFEEIREALPEAEFVGVKGRVEALRLVKDEDEVAAIREAVAVAERAFAMLSADLRAGQTEKDAADALESFLRRCGASASSFPPIVAVGDRSARPHAQADGRRADRPGRLRPGRLGRDRRPLQKRLDEGPGHR